MSPENSSEWVCLCGVEHSLAGDPEFIECGACGARYIGPMPRLPKGLHLRVDERLVPGTFEVRGKSPVESAMEDLASFRNDLARAAFGQWYSHEHRN